MKVKQQKEENVAVVLVVGKGQSHGSMKVSEAVVVRVDKVKGERPLDGTTASSWGGTYQTKNNHFLLYCTIFPNLNRRGDNSNLCS